MSEVATQDHAGQGHEAVTEQADHAGSAPTSVAHTMIARGRRSPDDLAELLRRFPFAQREILSLVQATLGNSVVQAVMSLFQPASHDAAGAQPIAATPVSAPAVGPSAPVSRAELIPLGPVRVTAQGLRVRRSPDASGEDNILGGLHHNAEVVALAHQGEWIRIEYHGQTAFIHGDYVAAVKPKAGAQPEGADAAQTDAVVAPPPAPAPAPAPVAPVTATPEVAAAPTSVPAPLPVAPVPEVKAPAPVADHTPVAPLPVVAPAPVPEVAKPTAVDDKHVAPKVETPTVEKSPAPDKPAGLAEMFARVYTTSVHGKACHTQVFVTPGNALTATPNIAVYFHGYEAQYGIGDKGAGTLSGIDVAAEATAAARDKNTVVILPQGNIGRNAEAGGHMKVLEAGLPAFLTSILTPLSADLGRTDVLSPGHISLSGHSAGGYEGMAHALGGADTLLGSITDVTLMDSDYAESHYAAAVKWMFDGKPAVPSKNLRIIEQASQLAPTEHLKPDAKRKPHINYHDKFFKPGNLTKLAESKGCTVEHLEVEGEGQADVRGKTNTVVQRSRVSKGGKVMADILIMRSSLQHQQLRDSVLDDQIASVGEGETSNDTFGARDTVVKDALKHARAQGAGSSVAPASQEKAPPHAEAATGVTGHATAPSDEHAKPDATDKTNAAPDHEIDEHPTHVDGNPTTAEKPKAKPSTTPAKKVGREVYAAGGILSKEHLHQYSLTDAEFAFKGRVYDAAVARLGDKIYGGVPADQLKPIGNGQQIRADVVGPLQSMLDAMRSAIAAKTPVNGVEVGKATGVGITSGYRSPEHDRDLWDSYFQKYMVNTADERAATGDPFGDKALKLMVHYIGQRKAPAGGSNHSNGIAVDLSMEMNGHLVGNNYDDQHVWKSSWHFAWLQANASSYGFKNYPKEHWHWDYKP